MNHIGMETSSVDSITRERIRMSLRLNLVTIRSSDMTKAARIYESIGFNFARHAHGKGPEHFSSEGADFVFEIYPLLPAQLPTISTRLGFEVDSVDQVLNDALAAGAKLVTPAQHSPWGYRAVIIDNDGHRIELTEANQEK